MSPEDILFDSAALERWAGEGGHSPVDEEATEEQRCSLSQLREWHGKLAENENDLNLLFEIMRGAISFADFASAIGRHRSNGKRRVEQFLARLRRRLAAHPELLTQLPN